MEIPKLAKNTILSRGFRAPVEFNQREDEEVYEHPNGSIVIVTRNEQGTFEFTGQFLYPEGLHNITRAVWAHALQAMHVTNQHYPQATPNREPWVELDELRLRAKSDKSTSVEVTQAVDQPKVIPPPAYISLDKEDADLVIQLCRYYLKVTAAMTSGDEALMTEKMKKGKEDTLALLKKIGGR